MLVHNSEGILEHLCFLYGIHNLYLRAGWGGEGGEQGGEEEGEGA